MTQSRIDIWIEAGYKLLAKEGLEGVKIERLAKLLNLNKSGFYHYFGTLDSFVERLNDYHIGMAKTVADEIAVCNSIDPDLLHLVIKHKIFFLVESQFLNKNRYIDLHVEEAGSIINGGVLSLWGKIAGAPDNLRVTYTYLNMIRHFLYARIDERNMTYEFLHQLSAETKEVLAQMIMVKEAPLSDQRAKNPSD